MTGGDPSIKLQPTLAAGGEARRFLRDRLAAVCDDQAVIDVLVLAGSELAANAILHARTDFLVTLRQPGPGVLRVEVTDGNTRRPQPGRAPLDATSGRGLSMIVNLGLDWGTQSAPGGKTVWAQLRI